ncbi:hypothetical protein BDV95DRAFT_597419 [Massariosphaeria phaeospora]|uniref:Uncharacterized protein n=1 Tax=Massariosphaeria phaeospora TaxID=100035 RepID=A0A7C8I184_9PLEO|nr:hypothetical protein BDV95DRAFT_597419 [Massariosphaeria phaeospora]
MAQRVKILADAAANCWLATRESDGTVRRSALLCNLVALRIASAQSHRSLYEALTGLLGCRRGSTTTGSGREVHPRDRDLARDRRAEQGRRPLSRQGTAASTSSTEPIRAVKMQPRQPSLSVHTACRAGALGGSGVESDPIRRGARRGDDDGYRGACAGRGASDACCVRPPSRHQARAERREQARLHVSSTALADRGDRGWVETKQSIAARDDGAQASSGMGCVRQHIHAHTRPVSVSCQQRPQKGRRPLTGPSVPCSARPAPAVVRGARVAALGPPPAPHAATTRPLDSSNDSRNGACELGPARVACSQCLCSLSGSFCTSQTKAHRVSRVRWLLLFPARGRGRMPLPITGIKVQQSTPAVDIARSAPPARRLLLLPPCSTVDLGRFCARRLDDGYRKPLYAASAASSCLAVSPVWPAAAVPGIGASAGRLAPSPWPSATASPRVGLPPESRNGAGCTLCGSRNRCRSEMAASLASGRCAHCSNSSALPVHRASIIVPCDRSLVEVVVSGGACVPSARAPGVAHVVAACLESSRSRAPDVEGPARTRVRRPASKQRLETDAETETDEAGQGRGESAGRGGRAGVVDCLFGGLVDAAVSVWELQRRVGVRARAVQMRCSSRAAGDGRRPVNRWAPKRAKGRRPALHAPASRRVQQSRPAAACGVEAGSLAWRLESSAVVVVARRWRRWLALAAWLSRPPPPPLIGQLQGGPSSAPWEHAQRAASPSPSPSTSTGAGHPAPRLAPDDCLRAGPARASSAAQCCCCCFGGGTDADAMTVAGSLLCFLSVPASSPHPCPAQPGQMRSQRPPAKP